MASETTAESPVQEGESQNKSLCPPTTSPSVTKDDKPPHDTPPSVKELQKVENYKVLDSKGDSHTFKSIYDGPQSTARVLVIFIRHFFCGVCVPELELVVFY